jgi:two-component system cell cycle sensor histidine kinase/response regulator CckA
VSTKIVASGPRTVAPSVLVVDDQDVVRMTASLLLGRHGYNVLQASSGADALAMMRESSDEIDAILADVVMPEMDGKTLFAHVARMSPTVPVIFMSGHNAAALDLPMGAPFVAKPFTEQALLKTLQESLGVATTPRASLNYPFTH